MNQGDGTVTAISLVDRSVVQTITTGTTPVWAVARSDSARIFVLNSGSGTVSADRYRHRRRRRLGGSGRGRQLSWCMTAS